MPAQAAALPRRPTASVEAAPPLPAPADGSVVARLVIPRLALHAAVVAGTNPFALSTAPGWVSTTALPGEDGTAVIAAHNATFFRHLNRLKPGQSVDVTTQQGRFVFTVESARVVKAGQPIVNTRGPSLALMACYPLNALYLTPWRYVVLARLSRSTLTPTRLPPASPSWPYRAVIPRAIAAHYNLNLSGNNLPMGTLTYRAPTTPATFAFEGTDLPYNLIAESLRLFFATRDAAAVGNLAAFRAMSTVPLAPPPFWGQPLTVLGPANVQISLSATAQPTAVRLELEDVHWGRTAVPWMTFRITVQGNQLRLAAITVAPTPGVTAVPPAPHSPAAASRPGGKSGAPTGKT